MSVNLRAIQLPVAASRTQPERTPARDGGPRQDFSALLSREAASNAATSAATTRRPGTASTPTVPTISDGGRALPSDLTSDGNLAGEGNEVTSRGTLSTDPRTNGMYIPPDFYHGSSYSPVFDHQDESGNWVPTPRFEGQVVYGPWRGSLPEDYDPNARVEHDPLLKQQGNHWWKQSEDGTWVKRETGYGGIPLYDDGRPMSTPDPARFPEYFFSEPETEET